VAAGRNDRLSDGGSHAYQQQQLQHQQLQQQHLQMQLQQQQQSQQQPLGGPSSAAASRQSDDFIGAPFDGAAILNRLEATKISPVVPQSSTFQRPHIPPPLVKSNTDTRIISPPLRSSASFSFPSNQAQQQASMSGQSQPGVGMGDVRVVESQVMSPKRYSDESSGQSSRAAVLRKKSGFSGFVNSLVGSPKKPIISAPENPVHVTHVGYDSNTGQFTVSSHFTCLFLYSWLPVS
jgi:p21-activated kinase 1